MLRAFFVLVLAALAAPARAEPADCNGALFQAAAHSNAAWTCEEVERRTLSGPQGARVLRSVRDASVPADLVGDRLARSLDAVETAYTSLQGLAGEFDFRFGSITVLIPDPQRVSVDFAADPFLDAGAVTYGTALPDECLIVLNPLKLDSLDLDFADAMLVHEVAHCVQGWSYPPSVGAPANRWWVEGTAILLQDVVLQHAPTMQANFVDFAKGIQKTPLTRLDYPSVVFWSWMMQTRRAQVPQLLRDLAEAGDEAAHQALLRAAMGEAGGREFARALHDGSIASPSGWTFEAWHDPTSTLAVEDDSGSYAITGAPFMISRAQFDIARGTYRFRPSVAPLDWRPAGGGAWDVIDGERVLGPDDCADVQSVVVVAFQTAADAGDLQVETTRETACAGCHAPSEVPACPVGTWTVSNEALAGMMQGWFDGDMAQMANGDAVTVESVLGTIAVDLKGDGAATWVLEGYQVNMLYEPAELPFAVEITVEGNGIVSGRWGASQGELRWCTDGTEGEFTSRVVIPGVADETTAWGKPILDSDWYMSCADGAMTLDYIGPFDVGRPMTWELTRRE